MSSPWWVLGAVAVGVLVSALVSFVLFCIVAARVRALERRLAELEDGASTDAERGP